MKDTIRLFFLTHLCDSLDFNIILIIIIIELLRFFFIIKLKIYIKFKIIKILVLIDDEKINKKRL